MMTSWDRLRRLTKGVMLRHVPGMITCVQFEGFVVDYLENRLASKEKVIFELHLKVCRECRSYLRAYQRAIETGRKVFEVADAPVPAEVPEDLVRAILAARPAAGGSGTSSEPTN